MELIFGAVVSLIVQGLKQYSPNRYVSLAILLVVSMAAAGVYTALVTFGYWTAVLGIITIASAVYAIFIRAFEAN